MSFVVCRNENGRVFSEEELKSRIYKGLVEAGWKRDTRYDWDLEKEITLENEWFKTTSKGYNSIKIYNVEDDNKGSFEDYGYISFTMYENDEEGHIAEANCFAVRASFLDRFDLNDKGGINLVFRMDDRANIILMG